MINTILKTAILYFLIFVSSSVFSQRLQVKTGFGNFEAFNIGLCHNFEKWRFEYGIGNDFNIYNQGYYSSLNFSIGKSILKKRKPGDDQLYFNFKSLVWNLENTDNIFSAVSLSTELLYTFKLGNLYHLGAYGGIAWSSVFRYKRKNYQNVGFPRDWQPNFGLTLYRNLK